MAPNPLTLRNDEVLTVLRVMVEVDDAGEELVSALMWHLGASGVELQDGATLAEGREPLATGRARAVAFFGGISQEALLGDIQAQGAAWGLDILAASAEEFTDESWKENWKQFFKPTRVSQRLAVRPPWERYDAPSGVETVIIEPGLAFGTGTHATTQLCMATLDRLLAEHPAASMLDVGCGSGILSIAAAMLSPELQIEALDIDPEAMRVCQENLAVNGVADRVRLRSPDVGEVTQAYSLVVANILSHILIRLGETLTARVAPGGRLLLSGIGLDSESHVLDHYASLGMTLLRREEQDGWVALIMTGEDA